MRKLKFRAWDTVKNCMYDNVSFDSDYYHPAQVKSPDIDTLRFVLKDNCVIMQYTGMNDKNGKEIYEGDIMGSGVVKFINGGFCIEGKDYKNISISGNIFENLELIKKVKGV